MSSSTCPFSERGAHCRPHTCVLVRRLRRERKATADCLRMPGFVRDLPDSGKRPPGTIYGGPMAFNRPCLTCGILQTNGNRCLSCSAKEATKWKAAAGPSPYRDPAWRKLSARMRKKHPWCDLCGTTKNLTVDHLHALKDGGALIVPEHMLRVLCWTCHGRITKH